MSSTSPIRHMASILFRYKFRWMLPVVASMALAAVWTTVRPRQWQSSQGLLLRDEATMIRTNLGRFADVESRKVAQETVLDLARHPKVLATVLSIAGPPRGKSFRQGAPTPEMIEKLQEAVTVTAPRGAEFGKTEMLYLNVLAESRDRARRIATIMTDQIDRELRQLRKRRAASLVNELEQSVAVAEASLNRTTSRLVELEREAGADLPELRLLNQGSGDAGLLRQLLVQVDNELRQLRVKEHRQQQLLILLRQAQTEPDKILSAPNALLALQPSLRKLKEGLIAAELRAAQMKGELAPAHPRVRAALAAEQEIRRQLQQELRAGADSLAADLEVNRAHRGLLEQQKKELLARVDRVARLRADYANRNDQVQHATKVLDEARTNLAAARASWQAADTTQLLTRVGEPTVPRYPVGPRKAIVLGGSLFGGMILGIAVLWLTIPAGELFPTTAGVAPAAPQAGAVDALQAESSKTGQTEATDPPISPVPGQIADAAPYAASTTTTLP